MAPCDHPCCTADLRDRVSFFNTMTKVKEPFRPRLVEGPVSMYVCGVTVYDYSHIGTMGPLWDRAVCAARDSACGLVATRGM